MEKIYKGLVPQHLGIVIDDWIMAPPSQFALAWIGTKDRNTLENVLNKVNLGTRDNTLDISETPLLEHYVKNNMLNLGQLAKDAKKGAGSQKMVTKSNVLNIDQEGHKAFLSKNMQATLNIDSRRLRKQKTPYELSIYGPFDVSRWRFKGGTRFSDVCQERGTHWGEGLHHERLYLQSLPKKARSQFEQAFEVIDYARASGLTALADAITNDKDDIKFEGNVEIGEIAIPYTFDKKPHYGLEAFLMRYASQEVIKEVLAHQTGRPGLQEIDMMLLGKKIVNPKFLEQANNHIVKGAMLGGPKNFSDYNWAIIQAMEEHYFRNGRQFKGYSLEFENQTKNRSMSIVFDMNPRATREGAEEQKDISMRILLDNNFSLPYVMYKNFKPEKYTGKWSLGDRNPTEMINISADRQIARAKKWQETDWRTGEKALCTIREPTDSILDRASELLRNAYGSRISSFELRGKYIDTMRRR